MDLLLPPISFTISTTSSRRSSSKLVFHGDFPNRRKFFKKSHRISIPLQISSKSEYNSSSNGSLNRESDCEDLWRDSSSVEVIGIGSRKDAVLDFCLESSFESCPLRFWTIHMRDSVKVQLLQRTLGEDMVLRNVKGPLVMQPCPQAIVLVASAGYGLDHITAVEFLSAVKSAGGLAAAIVLKPFSFEGQRRQQEVVDLVKNLRECTNFCIVVETDSLLKKEAVTLAEALRSANNAVLLAINAVSVLTSDMHAKFLDAPHDTFKEVNVPEVLTLLEIHREAKVGFGAANNIKLSIARAVFDCPFFSGGVKDLNGMIICTFASANLMDSSDLHSFIHAFRQSTECTKEIILSRIHEPDLEPNLIVTTILVVGCNGQSVPQKKSFLSGLALRFPFVFSFWGGDDPEAKDHPSTQSIVDPCPSEEVLSASDHVNALGLNPSDGADQSLDVYSEEMETLFSNNYDEIHDLGKSNGEGKRIGFEFSEASHESVSSASHQGEPSFERESLNSWNFGPGFDIAQKWAKERATAFGATAKMDKINAYTLPVGVKFSRQSTVGPQLSNLPQSAEQNTLDDTTGEYTGGRNMPSWDALDIYSAASTLLKRRHVDVSRKQGLLSVRAASMLEAERDSHKKWSPTMEMQYRGGIYRGRCQGGLPEGKGRLTLADGSFYDGMWRYGKRSGLGAFYYSNGDVFQGSWRDDLMHGKGWFYFHTGDRWFANFWKGKANGEGRFYSKFGNIFFGNFQDGWRHGESLCIDVDGTRWAEIWDEGVLISRNKLDSESVTD
ncbi:GTP binding protein isoform X2 [Tasmannia lanceolata]|uniref:GTP binding protein isoform X2 n=1 Tax=Tasmannia lanceolata TaxID=3420 RepID=UPI004062BBDE